MTSGPVTPEARAFVLARRRTWAVAAVVLALWTVLVALTVVPVLPELADEGVSAQYVWLDSVAALVLPSLVAALAVTARLVRYGVGPAQLAVALLGGVVVGLGPHLLLLGLVRGYWWIADPEGAQVPLALRPDPSAGWAGLVLASTGRLAALVLLAVLLGWLSGRLGARGPALLGVTAAAFALVVVVAESAPDDSGGAWYAPVTRSLDVLLSGQPEEHVRVGGDCGPLGVAVCGEVVGTGGSAAYLAVLLVLVALVVVALSGLTALAPRRRRGRPTVRA